ncbi:MAG: hypothetical protein AAGH88_04505 [Planctomycetota bacterium]
MSWIFVAVGIAAIAAGSLIPAYLDTLETREQRKLIQLKADQLREERDRYRDFYLALQADEPILLERLAFTQLRLKPVGTDTADFGPIDPAAVIDSPDPDTIRQVAMQWRSSQSVEYWLSRPDLKQQARVAVELERPRDTRLIRTVTGEYRPFVSGFGAFVLLVGLWPRRGPATPRPTPGPGLHTAP